MGFGASHHIARCASYSAKTYHFAIRKMRTQKIPRPFRVGGFGYLLIILSVLEQDIVEKGVSLPFFFDEVVFRICLFIG